jgi:hypothetical protein
MLKHFKSQDGIFSLTFEDDGKVAYAYLKQGLEIVGDVWLYNRCGAPDKSEWADKNNLPFANCAEFIATGGHVTRPITLDDINVSWEYEDEVPVAYIYVFGDLYGVVSVGENPAGRALP